MVAIVENDMGGIWESRKGSLLNSCGRPGTRLWDVLVTSGTINDLISDFQIRQPESSTHDTASVQR